MGTLALSVRLNSRIQLNDMTEGLQMVHQGIVTVIRCGLAFAAVCFGQDIPAKTSAKPTDAWPRHTIDNSSRGADGVRLADMNGDGYPDIATGWEEGGITRVYQHPGLAKVRQPWPAVAVGKTPNVEDAVWADLDGDGLLDVVSSCEGKTRSLFVHWAPKNQSTWQDANVWRSDPFRFVVRSATPAESPIHGDQETISQQWMFALPLDVDGRNGIDLIVGSKGANASVGWLQSPRQPRDLKAWRYHRLADAGWIMSLQAVDIDGDHDIDVLFSDRRGDNSGVRWLENLGATGSLSSHTAPLGVSRLDTATMAWPVHEIGGRGREILFLDAVSLTAEPPDSLTNSQARNVMPDIEIVAAVKQDGLMRFRRSGSSLDQWSTETIDWPDGCGRPKAVAIGDMDLDGRPDLVISCESAKGLSGVRWLSNRNGDWQDYEISGVAGTKFDRIELVDLDEDGDLDVITCEERENLGVIWYENPTRNPR